MPSGNNLKDRIRPVYHRLKKRKDILLYGNCAVLLYHRVIDIPTDPQLLAVSPGHFSDHLSIIKNEFHPLTVEEFTHYLIKGKKFPKNSVLITFDDGYADNHLFARPILESKGLQGLFYISTGYIGKKVEYWWDELERLLLINTKLPEEYNFEPEDYKFHFSKSDISSIYRFYSQLLERFKKVNSIRREELMNLLRIEIPHDDVRKSHLPMSLDELKSFSRSSSVVLGAHTLLHPSLSSCSNEEIKREVLGSKSDLESWTGNPIPFFSYPFGTGADFDDRTIRVISPMGFSHVAGNYPGIVHARSPRTHFPRFLVRNWNGNDFRTRLTQFLI
ncbi:MAG: polysaccharide deacetylase family protein [Flavobacteriales bacterium]